MVILGAEEYERLVAPDDLVDFLRRSPLADALKEGDLDLERAPDTGRDVRI